MNVEIELGGRRRAVDVRRDGSDWVVTIDGRRVRATVAAVGDRWSLLVSDVPREGGFPGSPPEDGRYVESGFSRTWNSYEVVFETRGDASLVHVNGTAVALTVVDPRTHPRRRGSDAAGGAHGPSAIVAPMPGRIVKVLVGKGDHVGARQGVVVVEAMKMENELRTPRAGTVVDVRVSEGMTVEANAVLVVVE